MTRIPYWPPPAPGPAIYATLWMNNRTVRDNARFRKLCGIYVDGWPVNGYIAGHMTTQIVAKKPLMIAS